MKKNILRKLAVTALVFTIGFSNQSLAASAQTAEQSSGGSSNIVLTVGGKKVTLSQSTIDAQRAKHKTGYIKPEISLPQTDNGSRALTKSTNLPSSYDLRDHNKVTSVKDQSTSGCCWAFAAIGSLESSLMPSENDDFSENNLKNNTGYDIEPNNGGNEYDATSYFARWGGPYNKSQDPYDPNSESSTAAGSVQKHVQNVDWLPARTSSTDNDAIKAAVMQYGAVAVSFCMGGYDEDMIVL